VSPENKDNIFRISASILSVLGCFGVGVLTGSPEAAVAATAASALKDVVTGIGGNWLSEHLGHYSRRFFDKVTSDGTFNHDIEKAMQQALKQALQQTQAICINHFPGKEKKINDFFEWLKDESAGAFLVDNNTGELNTILAQVNARQLSEDNLRDLLQQHTGFDEQYTKLGLDTEFARVFWLHLPQQYSFYFKEELKAGTQAMQAVLLLFIDMTISLLGDMKRTGEDTNERVRGIEKMMLEALSSHAISKHDYDTRLAEVELLRTELAQTKAQLTDAHQQIALSKEREEQLIRELQQERDKMGLDEKLKAEIDELIAKRDYDEAEKLLAQQTEKKLKETAAFIFQRAGLQQLQLKYNEALALYQQAIALQPENALYLNNTANLMLTLGLYAQAIPMLGKALEVNRNTLGENSGAVATNYNNLGGAYKALGEFDKAIQYYEQALTILKQVFGEKHPKIAIRYNNLGGVYHSLGDNTKAIQYYERALVIFKQAFGDIHEYVAGTYNNLGGAYESLGDYTKAIQYYEQALAIDVIVFGKKHPKIAIRYNNLGGTYKALYDHTKAIQYYEQALAIDVKVFGENHPKVAIRYNNLGSTYDSLGDYTKAIQYYEQALAIDKKMYGTNHPDIAIDYSNLAVTYYYLKNYPQSISYLQKALAIYTQFFKDDHPNVIQTQKNLDYVISQSKK
jgi:tetratricopeptide (TPR) repeat protein